MVPSSETKRGGSRSAPVKLRPPQIASHFGIHVQKVLHWIKTGELRAVNLATSTAGKKPRWVVDPDDLADFERRRSNAANSTPPPRATPRKRRSKADAADVTKFY